MHSAAWKHFCLNRGVEVGFCISGIYGKIYLVKTIQLHYIFTYCISGHVQVFFFFFSYVIRLYLGCFNSWCHMTETPAFVCRRPICVIHYVGTLCALGHYELIRLTKDTILDLLKEKQFIIWDLFNAHLEAPLVNLGFRLLTNNTIYCYLVSAMVKLTVVILRVSPPCDCVIVLKIK